MPRMDTAPALGFVVAALAAASAYLFLPRRRSGEERGRLERAASRIDRELAGNLELVGMFLQTKQPTVLDVEGYEAERGAIADADAELAARVDALYERLPAAESAMERRGPAGSFRGEDRAIVEGWEGEARALQREIRALPGSRPPTPGARLLARIFSTRGRRAER